MPKQIAEIFREKGKFLHIREIIDAAKAKGVKLDEKSIKQAVYALKADETIANVSINGSYQNTFWGSKKWLDSKGEPKPEHMYDQTLIVKTKENIEI